MPPPRHLVLRKLAKARAMQKDVDPTSSSKDPPLPNPGDMRVYSYYKPGLVAAEYTITTTQSVLLPGDVNIPANWRPLPTPPNPQTFEVIAPQFTLDPNIFHSTYPP